jgi:competence protein ComEC
VRHCLLLLGKMRHELSRRPSLLIAGAIICGLVAFDQPLAIILSLVLIWLAEGIGWRLSTGLALLAGLALAPAKVPQIADTTPMSSVMTVASIPDISSFGQTLVVESGGRYFALACKEQAILAPGDEIEVKGTLGPLSDTLSRATDERTLSGRIRAEAGDISVLKLGPAFYRPSVIWRAEFVEFVRRTVTPKAAAAINALCFNVTADLDQETYSNLQRTGTVHIVSASGLHVLIFAGGLSLLLGLLPIPRGWKLLLIGAILILYAVGAGMRPPVIRSVAMAAFLGGATLFRKEPDLLSALGATAAAYLLWRPIAVYDLGFQFSFITVAALGMFLELREDLPTSPLRRMGATLIEVAKASLVATLASAPLTAYYFGTVSVVSIPANVLIAIALPAITLTAFAAHLITGVTVPLGTGLMIGLAQPLTGWILWVADTFGNLAFSAIAVPPFSAYWMLPYYAVALMLWRPRARPI